MRERTEIEKCELAGRLLFPEKEPEVDVCGVCGEPLIGFAFRHCRLKVCSSCQMVHEPVNLNLNDCVIYNPVLW